MYMATDRNTYTDIDTVNLEDVFMERVIRFGQVLLLCHWKNEVFDESMGKNGLEDFTATYKSWNRVIFGW